MWALKPPLGLANNEGASAQSALLKSAINWAPSAELCVFSGNRNPVSVLVAKIFSLDNILVKNPPNL